MCLISRTKVGIQIRARDKRLTFFCAQNPSAGACGFPNGAFFVWHGNSALVPFMPAGAVKNVFDFKLRNEDTRTGQTLKGFFACRTPAQAHAASLMVCFVFDAVIVHWCRSCLQAPWKDAFDLQRASNPEWGSGANS